MMAEPEQTDASGPDEVVVLAPFGRDAAVVCATLRAADIACSVVTDVHDLVARLRGGVGAALMTEEALSAAGATELARALEDQPSWSDVPLLLLLVGGERLVPESARTVSAVQCAGNVTVL